MAHSASPLTQFYFCGTGSKHGGARRGRTLSSGCVLLGATPFRRFALDVNVVRCVSSATLRRLAGLLPYPETCQHRRSAEKEPEKGRTERAKLRQTGIWRNFATVFQGKVAPNRTQFAVNFVCVVRPIRLFFCARLCPSGSCTYSRAGPSPAG